MVPKKLEGELHDNCTFLYVLNLRKIFALTKSVCVGGGGVGAGLTFLLLRACFINKY